MSTPLVAFAETRTTAVLPRVELMDPKGFSDPSPSGSMQLFNVSPPWQTVCMEVLGDTALTSGAPHGDALQGATALKALFPGAVFPFEAVPDGWFTGEVFPLDDESAAGGCVYDDYLDAVVPEDPFPGGEYPDGVFPEDPFPEILENPFLALRSKDHLFADTSGAGGAASSAGGGLPGADTPPASGLNPDNLVRPAKTLLPA
ncbi:MAG TPA: hypothetical protein VJS86_01980, partial [Arthrobacter sp.]|nr:hypothetical protein [Arthrobacter sp.]